MEDEREVNNEDEHGRTPPSSSSCSFSSVGVVVPFSSAALARVRAGGRAAFRMGAGRGIGDEEAVGKNNTDTSVQVSTSPFTKKGPTASSSFPFSFSFSSSLRLWWWLRRVLGVT